MTIFITVEDRNFICVMPDGRLVSSTCVGRVYDNIEEACQLVHELQQDFPTLDIGVGAIDDHIKGSSNMEGS